MEEEPRQREWPRQRGVEEEAMVRVMGKGRRKKRKKHKNEGRILKSRDARLREARAKSATPDDLAD